MERVHCDSAEECEKPSGLHRCWPHRAHSSQAAARRACRSRYVQLSQVHIFPRCMYIFFLLSGDCWLGLFAC